MDKFDIKKFLTESKLVKEIDGRSNSELANEILDILTWESLDKGVYAKVANLLASMNGVEISSKFTPISGNEEI